MKRKFWEMLLNSAGAACPWALYPDVFVINVAADAPVAVDSTAPPLACPPEDAAASNLINFAAERAARRAMR